MQSRIHDDGGAPPHSDGEDSVPQGSLPTYVPRVASCLTGDLDLDDYVGEILIKPDFAQEGIGDVSDGTWEIQDVAVYG